MAKKKDKIRKKNKIKQYIPQLESRNGEGKDYLNYNNKPADNKEIQLLIIGRQYKCIKNDETLKYLNIEIGEIIKIIDVDWSYKNYNNVSLYKCKHYKDGGKMSYFLYLAEEDIKDNFVEYNCEYEKEEERVDFIENNVNQILMDKIVDFWNYYVDKCGSTVETINERIEMARYIHSIQGILAIRELKSNGHKLFK
jgi:hypothetical protein